MASAGKPLTFENMFLAMLAILTAQVVTVSGDVYWAYVPHPPFLHPVGWGEETQIKIMTNNTQLLGGYEDFISSHQMSQVIDYEGMSDTTPICVTIRGRVPPGCLPINYRTLLTDAPDRNSNDQNNKRLMWEIGIMTLGYYNYNESYILPSENMPLPNCFQIYHDKDQFWDSFVKSPKWLECGFQKASVHQPYGSNDYIYDYSVESPDYDYTDYLKYSSEKFGGYAPNTLGEPIRRWFTPGWVAPIFVSHSTTHNITGVHSGLFRLFAAANMLLLKKPKEKVSTSIGIRACVGYPFGILAGKSENVTIINQGKSYYIKCQSCILTNCLTSNLNKQYSVIILLQRPEYVMLPVDLKEDPWFDNAALQTLKNLDLLLRPKRFVVSLVLGISALIAILTSLAVSTAALVEEVKTANFVNDLSKKSFNSPG